MSSHTPLRLFPSNTSTVIHRSNSNSRQKSAREDFKGLALHVTTLPVANIPSDPIQHALFCDPPARPPSRSKFHNGKRVSTCSSRYSQVTAMSPQAEDQLTPLPVNTQFTTNSPPKRGTNPFRRDNTPAAIRAPARDEVSIVDDDQLSPLPTKTSLNTNGNRVEYPAPLRSRSTSPHLTRSNTTGTRWTVDSHDDAPPMRSMFPQYDPSRPIDAQQYFPTTQPSEPVMTSPVEKRGLARIDSAVTLVDGYEHIPVAEPTDLGVIWKASIDGVRKGTRKVQLSIHQPSGQGTSITIGSSSKDTLYSMTTSQQSGQSKGLAIQKHSSHESTNTQVAHVPMPTPEDPDQTTIFPQIAAINAIEAVSTSPSTTRRSTFDVRGSSYAAVRLAQEAIEEAHHRHECRLQRTIRQRDLMGGVTATYSLSHPEQGNFAITVSRSTIGKSGATRAKISLHHPTATPAAIAAENLVLAFLDFGRDACVLDIPGLLAFESNHVIDIAVCALLSVAAIESEEMKKDVVSFPAPPKTPMSRSESKKAATTSPQERKKLKRSKSKKGSPPSDFKAGEEVEVPGALALVGMTFKAGFFLVKISLRATKGVVVGAHDLAKKL